MLKELSNVSLNLPIQGVRLLMEESSKYPAAIHLEVGEPNVNTPLNIREAATKAMQEEVTHYTPNAGLVSLRETIKSNLKKKYDLHIDKEQIAVTAGAVNALMVSFLAIVNPGDEVLIPDPGWPNYEMMLSIIGAVPKRYELNPEKNFTLDVDYLNKLVTDKTKAILINSPANPTGTVFSEAVTEELILFATTHNLYAISDEVYDDLIFEKKHYSLKCFDKDDRVVSIFSFSKSYAMTGWRVGYAIGPKRIIERMTKLIEPIISCAPAFAQRAAEIALVDSDDFLVEMRRVYKQRRDNVYQLFLNNGIPTYNPEGTFYMLIDISHTNLLSEEFAFKLLQEEEVAVAPGNTFGNVTKHMCRISLATDMKELLEGTKRINRFINKYKNRANI